MRLLLVACLLAAADAPRVIVQVTPRVFLRDSSFRVTCKVPRDATNRALEMGVEGLSYSTIPLEGEDAWITHERTFHHAECGIGPAFCVLHSVENGKLEKRRAAAELHVAGCRDAEPFADTAP